MKLFITVLFLSMSMAFHGQSSSFGLNLLGRWDSSLPPANGSNAKYNEVWGFVYNGEEFGVIGSTLGTHIIHIAKNNALTEVGFIEGDASGDYVIHRDFDVHENILYAVCDQEPASLQIIDFSGLPESIQLIDAVDTYFTTAHNVTVDSYRQKLYISGPSGHALCVMDIINPTEPQFMAYFDGVDYVHDCYVRRDTAFLHCGPQGLFVFNFENPNSPQALGSLEEYPEKGYNHSGWWSEDGTYYVFTDETPGMRLKLCDVTDLSNIEVRSLFNSGSDPQTMAHNVMIKHDTAYVSHYFDGLQVFDLTQKENPKRVAWYDTYLEPDISGRGAWGVYAGLPSGKILVSDRQRGLHVFARALNHSLAGTTAPIISPNPGNGNIAVSLTKYNTFNEVEHHVFTSQGKMIDSGTWVNTGSGPWFPIDLSNAASGTYFIEISIDGVTHLLKYLKL